MTLRGRRRMAVPVLFLAALTALAGPPGAEDKPATIQPIDLTGMYATTHPKESWGEVLVRFRPCSSVLSYRGTDYAAYEVSLWKRRGDAVRKLRDGLFGTYTLAATVPDRQGLALLWYSPDEGKFQYNRIVGVGPDRSLSIGSQDLAGEEDAERRVLEYVGRPPAPEASFPESPDLAGIYEYYHSSTGRVLVGFRKAGDGADGVGGADGAGAAERYSVAVLSPIAGIGYAVVHQGLYGGSLADDSYPLVELRSLNGERWLVWSNPAKPRRVRKNRIVCWYENGDIGIGLDQGEGKYVENTVFKRISGLDAEIRRYADFITLEGVYGVTLRGSASEVIAAILPTKFVSDTGREKIPVFRIRSAEQDGLWPGDPFHHLGLRSEEGRCILVWYSFALQVKEQLLLYDLDRSGSFKLGSLRTDDPEEQVALAEFRKIAPLPGRE